MSVGLMALLDDVATLAKAAAASIDDVAGQAAKAGTKAAGVVIDDTAVTPRYLTDFSPARELPVVGRIALGSAEEQAPVPLPAALVLSLLLPQAITPLADDGRRLSLLRRRGEGHEVVLSARRAGPRGQARDGGHRCEDLRGRRRSRAPSRPTSSSRPRSWPSPWPPCPRTTVFTQAIILAVVAVGINGGGLRRRRPDRQSR